MAFFMVKANIPGIMDSCMRETSSIIPSRAMVFLNGPMEVSMRGRYGMDIVMEMENLIQLLIRQNTLVTGWWGSTKAKGPYTSIMVATIKDNFRKIKNMEKGKWSTHPRMNMKGNGSTTRNKGKESWIGGNKMKSMRAIGKITYHTVMENTIGSKIKPNTKF